MKKKKKHIKVRYAKVAFSLVFPDFLVFTNDELFILKKINFLSVYKKETETED